MSVFFERGKSERTEGIIFTEKSSPSAKTLDKKSNDGGDSSSSPKLSAWQHLDESL